MVRKTMYPCKPTFISIKLGLHEGSGFSKKQIAFMAQRIAFFQMKNCGILQMKIVVFSLCSKTYILGALKNYQRGFSNEYAQIGIILQKYEK